MRNFKSNTKNTDVAGLLFKVCAWILSIMLIVTGIAPSFANNAKAGNGVADFKGNATICEKKSFDSKEKADATKLQTITNKQAIKIRRPPVYRMPRITAILHITEISERVPQIPINRN